ncbi:MAG: PaaI family thioesterase [Alphaproteobacteria bacterium]
MTKEEELAQQLNGFNNGLPKTLGINVLTASPDEITAELEVTEALCTIPAILHGGAHMAFADNLGALATVINLPPGATTTTLESKTNFLGAIPVGEKAYGTTTCVHKGRTTQVWRTEIKRADGKLCSVVTQTQLVMQGKA